jgi:hypothetical protein
MAPRVRLRCHLSVILVMAIGTRAVTAVTTAYRTTGFGIILASRRAERRLTRAAVTERRIGMSMGSSRPTRTQVSFRSGSCLQGMRVPSRMARSLLLASCIAAIASCGSEAGTAPSGARGTAPVANIAFDRSVDSVEVERTSTVTASFASALGARVTPASTSWSVADSTIATVSQSGEVTGIRTGTTSITLVADKIVRSLPVVVLPPAVATITFATTSFTMTEGDTLTIPVPTVVDRTGAVVTGRTPAYTTASPNVNVTPAGLVTAITAGTGSVTATIDTAKTTLTFTVLPAVIGRVKLIPGVLDMGVGHTIATQASAFSVDGHPLTRRTYTYTIDNPSVASVTSTGIVSGIAPGTATLKVATGSGSLNVPVSVAQLGAAGFAIDLRFIGNVSSTVRQAAIQAAARWEQVISTPLIPYHIITNAGDCGKGIPAIDTTETSVMIIIQADSIDGRAKTVGLGGPCVIRDDSPQLTALGTVTIDTADVGGLAQQNILVGTLTHEMGHILGIGTLWSLPSYTDLATGLGGSDPEFTGRAGRAASELLGFTADSSLGVPIENTGGSGTADAHWRATVFGHELMTGTIHSGLNPLSLLTIEALADFGYTVVPEAADDFNVLNATAPGAPIQPSANVGILVRETILLPRFTTTRTGTLRRIPGMRQPARPQ